MVKSYKDLKVYQKAFELMMEIFYLVKGWPREERYNLTDQILRSSRSVCGNVAEANVSY
jgi:four helix bundle protein